MKTLFDPIVALLLVITACLFYIGLFVVMIVGAVILFPIIVIAALVEWVDDLFRYKE